jgi:hypothetical protein
MMERVNNYTPNRLLTPPQMNAQVNQQQQPQAFPQDRIPIGNRIPIYIPDEINVLEIVPTQPVRYFLPGDRPMARTITITVPINAALDVQIF